MFEISYFDIETGKTYNQYVENSKALEHIIHAINVTKHLMIINIKQKNGDKPNV